MTTSVRALVIAAAIGSGLVGGVMFAFSTFIMPALRRLPAADGARAMQEINRTAVKPPLMIALFGTGVLGVVLIVIAARSFGERQSPWLLAAGVVYFASAVVVTIAANVPQNDKLEALDAGGNAAHVSAVWDAFASTWTAWNHVRTIGSLAAGVLFAVALALED